MPHDHEGHAGGHAYEHAHGHTHSHGASGGHAGHSHGPATYGTAFAVGVAANVALVVLQVGAGLWAHSTALLADAVHNLGDMLGLVLAWWGAVLARRAPNARHTYGWGRGSILAALANATVLLIGTGAITVEAVQRLVDPAPVAGGPVMAVAAAAIVLNGAVALMFMRGRERDLNVRGAFLHMAADAGVSAGVVVAAGLIILTGAQWIDPVASLVISAVVVWSSWGLLRESTALAMDGVPPGLDPDAIRARLGALPGVTEVHDLHIWALSTTRTAVTAHLVSASVNPQLVPMACTALQEGFGIAHCTFQVETVELATGCALRPDCAA